jgi:hypothetical protein
MEYFQDVGAVETDMAGIYKEKLSAKLHLTAVNYRKEQFAKIKEKNPLPGRLVLM